MEYNSGNYDKYMSANPLKRAMVNRLNGNIMAVIGGMINNRNRTYQVLDAGCGEGFLTRFVYDKFQNIEITGIEYTEEALAIAQKMKASKTDSRIHFCQGDICHLPFEDGSFDIVLCTEVLEHLEKPDAALRELLRVAEKAVLLTVPDEPWFCLGNLIVLKNVKNFGNPSDHINHWTYRGFCKYIIKFTRGGKKRLSVKAMRSFPWSIVCIRKGGGTGSRHLCANTRC